MAKDQHGSAGEAGAHYRVLQLHSRRFGNQTVMDFEDLVTHHPISNSNARVEAGRPVEVENSLTRSYGVIGGEVQELETRRTDGGSASEIGVDQILLVKDFMLEDSRIPSGASGVRNVDVPSPVSGVIGTVNERAGLVDILDREGGEVIARIRHMHPIHVREGDVVGYGQAIGTQGNRATVAIHVHMEVDTRYYQQYENYVGDLVSGRLGIDAGRRGHGIEARPVIDDGVIRIGETAASVRLVQQRLNGEGFLGADGRALVEDGVYRLGMQAAVIQYQHARGLPVTGDLDAHMMRRVLPRMLPPEVHGPQQRGEQHYPPMPPYMPLHGSMPDDQRPPSFPAEPLLLQARHAVLQLDQALERQFDGQSECLAASAAHLAKSGGLHRIDHVLLSGSTGTARGGENLLVVQGALGDPASRWVAMKTSEALSAPLEQSLARLHALEESAQTTPPPLEPARERHHLPTV